MVLGSLLYRILIHEKAHTGINFLARRYTPSLERKSIFLRARNWRGSAARTGRTEQTRETYQQHP